MVIPLFIGREKSIKAIEEAMDEDRQLVLAAQRDLEINDPSPSDIFNVGTLAKVLQLLKLPEGAYKVLVEGVKRVKITNYIMTDKMMEVSYAPIRPKKSSDKATEAQMRNISSQFEKYMQYNKDIPVEVLITANNEEKADKFIDIIAAHLKLKVREKQEILEQNDTNSRLRSLSTIMAKEIEILALEDKIKGQVRDQIEDSQREYYLHEQLKAIERELGQSDETTSEIEEIRRRAKETGMHKTALTKVESELSKLAKMAPLSPEATVVRNYLDWIIDIPWDKRTEDKLNIKESRKILDEDHYGLKKPKERILEFLAVQERIRKRSKKPQIRGPILCFVGAPGVGKTSLAKSIARSMERNFVRISLGGVRDEAEIRGHRKTYIGSMPGRIIQSMKKAGSKNPVFLLDEIDKIGMDFRGDPAAALLEVLDPEQNHAFNDHYLELDYDLSEVLFVTTANMIETIPPALEDRMEVIRLPGYTLEEKIKISQQFLIPKQVEAHGLTKKEVVFEEAALDKIISGYTREAGVRNLEREIATICRKAARAISEKKKRTPIRITERSLKQYLGVLRYQNQAPGKRGQVGVATGLAWTEFGGQLLATEASVVKGKGRLTLTGKLGEVMRESAQAALSYVRSRSDKLKLDEDFYHNSDIHIHVPEGAIPKDGPSAGITMATAIISALTDKPVRADLAMTGEITLRGRVLPIGGLKEKVLAAHREGIHNIIIPKANKKDLEDIEAKVRKDINFILVDKMDQVLPHVIQ
jgi:ATP-dependent Lon protease